MKKILFPLLSLFAASFAFAGGDACKIDAKDAKGCCCCCCAGCKDAKDDKACAMKKGEAKPDAAPAATSEKK